MLILQEDETSEAFLIDVLYSQPQLKKIKETKWDWEDFKRRTIHLNKAITQKQRIQQFQVEAKRAWRQSQVEIPTVDIVEEETESEEKKIISSTPSLIKTVLANLKSYLYCKQYVDLIQHITKGEGIYPKIWDSHADEIRDELLRVRAFNEEDVQQWAREHHHDDSPLTIS